MSVKDWAEAYKIAAQILTGGAQGAIVWDGAVREKFVQWMRANGRSVDHIRNCVAYLNKYVTRIEGPEDIIKVFNQCERGRHHLERALRALLNYYEAAEGFDPELLNRLRAAIPKVKVGVDLREVDEDRILETFRALRGLQPGLRKYYALWSLILDSGIRLTHAIYLMNTFKVDLAARLSGFCRYPVGLEREVKHTWFAYMREPTLQLVAEAAGLKITKAGVLRFLSHLREKGVNIVNPKYVRKFAYNKMIEAGIPESVADWINGRAPQTIGARHYMWMREQADQYYPRYAAYLNALLSGL
ncbi:MAG: integrase [Candidatus Bathyarchaeia archaeon]